jgi:hypothetical protein
LECADIQVLLFGSNCYIQEVANQELTDRGPKTSHTSTYPRCLQ